MVCHGAVVVFACEGWNVVKYVRVFFAQCSSRAEEIENINAEKSEQLSWEVQEEHANWLTFQVNQR